jgi:hypothetical protein
MNGERFKNRPSKGRSWIGRLRSKDIWRALELPAFIGRQEERRIESQVRREHQPGDGT